MKAFVLSGGGALGAFEVGVLNQLDKKGIKADLVLGTSTGALNATGYSFKGLDFLTKMWEGIKGSEDVFKNRGWLLGPIYMLFGNGKGLNSSEPLVDKINQTIDCPPSIPVGVCKVSLKTTAAEYVYAKPGEWPKSEKDYTLMRKATLASTTTPIYNDVVDNEWVDGGLRHIAPLGEAIRQGADEIYVILCEQYQENQKPNYDGKIGNVLKVAGYTVNTMVQGVLWNDVKVCQKINSLIGVTDVKINGYKRIKLHVYAPLKSIGDSADFSPKHISDLINYGYTINPVF
jgi:NTE family protein